MTTKRKIQLAGFSEAHKFSRQIAMFTQFIFRRQPAEFFFTKNIRQMKAGQNNKYDTYILQNFCVGLIMTIP